jgi:hypothetical protein
MTGDMERSNTQKHPGREMDRAVRQGIWREVIPKNIQGEKWIELYDRGYGEK